MHLFCFVLFTSFFSLSFFRNLIQRQVIISKPNNRSISPITGPRPALEDVM